MYFIVHILNTCRYLNYYILLNCNVYIKNYYLNLTRITD